jgi:hypothetical protein
MALDLKPSMTIDQNNSVMYDYYQRLRALAIARFQWTGLPDTIPARYIEQTLFEYGRVLFFEDKSIGLLCLKCTPSGKYNPYNEPLTWTVAAAHYDKNGVDIPADKSVLIRNNYDVHPTDWTIRLYASKLYEIDRTMTININAQKTPVLVLCDEKQRLTLKNLYRQYQGNEPVIFGDKALNKDAITSIKTDAPFSADKLMRLKHDTWNEAMSFLGIENSNTDKRERLITSEVESNNESTEISALVMLLTRREAAEQINQMFGLNVSVKMRSLYDEKELREGGKEEIENSEGGDDIG